DEIYENTQKENGKALRQPKNEPEQLDIFSFLDEPIDIQEEETKEMQYIPVKIIDVYKEEME
ncbi:MAG: methylase, partial [Tissierellia bacterium]|nr:methylase [Tissierellia bacterium]